MSPFSHEAISASVAYAECFLLCYIYIWLFEQGLESYNAGILEGIPNVEFWTMLVSALGAGFCILSATIMTVYKSKDKEPSVPIL